jgi:hypothetical protein
MKTFELHRVGDENGAPGIIAEDAAGVLGTGIIAQGVVFDDGTCALRWLTLSRSTSLYDDLKTLERIHGHNGKTRVVYTGAPFDRGVQDAAQDRIECVPFSSVGGPSRRASMVAPDYITPTEREAYLLGYQAGATAVYGTGWKDDPAWDAPPVAIPGPKDGAR